MNVGWVLFRAEVEGVEVGLDVLVPRHPERSIEDDLLRLAFDRGSWPVSVPDKPAFADVLDDITGDEVSVLFLMKGRYLDDGHPPQVEPHAGQSLVQCHEDDWGGFQVILRPGDQRKCRVLNGWMARECPDFYSDLATQEAAKAASSTGYDPGEDPSL